MSVVFQSTEPRPEQIASGKKPLVMLVGGPDVNSRIRLIQSLLGEFDFSVAGTSSTIADEFARAGVTYRCYPLSRGLRVWEDIRGFFRLRRIFRELCPDIVHTFDTKPSLIARLAARSAGVPIVIGTLPGLGALYSYSGFRTKVLRGIYESIQRWSSSQANLTIFQNPDDLHDLDQLGLLKNARVTVIPGSGVETDYYDPQSLATGDREQTRSELKISDSTIIITMISRVMHSKGVMVLAEAARKVRAEVPVEFLLAGAVDHTNDGLNDSQLATVGKSVRLLGECKNVRDLLNASDIFVLPSTYREGIPRSCLEASSMGLPIVTTDGPGCRETAKHGVTGFLVPPGDAMQLANHLLVLCRDAGLRRKQGRESRLRTVRKFDLSRIARMHAEIYKELLECHINGRDGKSERPSAGRLSPRGSLSTRRSD